MTELELYHHGILGQKWGIRRFQNKDGSLTSAGRKRVKNLYQESRDDKQGKKPPVEEKTKAEELYERVKPTSELTNEELEYAIRRVELERKYNELYAPKTPEQKSFSQKLNESKDKIAALTGALDGAAKLGAAALGVAKLFGYKTKAEKKKEAKEAAEKATKAERETWEFEEKKKEAARKEYAFNEGIAKKKKEAEDAEKKNRNNEKANWQESWSKIFDKNDQYFSSSQTKAYSDIGKQWASRSDSKNTIWDVPFEDVTEKRSGGSSYSVPPGIDGLI